jgi:DNA-binding Lrp family transcriptional regulator
VVGDGPLCGRDFNALSTRQRPVAVSGQIDYMVLLRCDTPEKLDMILDQLGQIDGVNHTQTSMVLSRKIDRRSTVSNSD